MFTPINLDYNLTEHSNQKDQKNSQNNSSEPPRKRRKISSDWIYSYLNEDEKVEYTRLQHIATMGPTAQEITRFQTLTRLASARRQRENKRLSQNESINEKKVAIQQETNLIDPQTRLIEELQKQINFLQAENRDLAVIINTLTNICQNFQQKMDPPSSGIYTQTYSTLPNSSPMLFQYEQPTGQSVRQQLYPLETQQNDSNNFWNQTSLF